MFKIYFWDNGNHEEYGDVAAIIYDDNLIYDNGLSKGKIINTFYTLTDVKINNEINLNELFNTLSERKEYFVVVKVSLLTGEETFRDFGKAETTKDGNIDIVLTKGLDKGKRIYVS